MFIVVSWLASVGERAFVNGVAGDILWKQPNSKKKPGKVYYAPQYANLQNFGKVFSSLCLEFKVLQVRVGRFLIGDRPIFKNPA